MYAVVNPFLSGGIQPSSIAIQVVPFERLNPMIGSGIFSGRVAFVSPAFISFEPNWGIRNSILSPSHVPSIVELSWSCTARLGHIVLQFESPSLFPLPGAGSIFAESITRLPDAVLSPLDGRVIF